MKTFGAALLIIASLALCHGGVIVDKKEDLHKSFAELVNPLLDEITTLKERINDDDIRKAASRQYLTRGFVDKLDMDACADLALALELGGETALNASLQVYSLGVNVTTALWDLLNCPQLNPFKAGECLYHDLTEVKNLILTVKPMFLTYKSEVKTMVSFIEMHYMECVGKAPATQYPKPTSKPSS